jgi:hypothetical protein
VKRFPIGKILLTFQYILLVIFAALLVLKAYSTLGWHAPLFHYAAFLMDKYALVPYRDIFETSMPGTFAFYYLIAKLFGYGDLPFRSVDLTLLGLLLVTTYAFMSRFGRLVAAWAAILFGLLYLTMGQSMSLQRDYIGIIPVACALLCIPVKTDIPVRLARFALLGLLFGMSVLIKPHLVIALPIVFGALLAFRWQFQKKSTLDFLKCAAISCAALLVPLTIALVWLAANSALAPFFNMLFNDLPLHNLIAGNHGTITGLARVFYLIERTSTFGGLGPLLLSSLFAYYHVIKNANKDKATAISLTCLCLCTLAYAVYPMLAGGFWPSHYMPFAYFCCVSTGLCFFTWHERHKSPIAHKIRETLCVLILVVAITVQLPLFQFTDLLTYDLQSGTEAHAPFGGRVDELANWLKTRLHPGDTVQPLDWTGGSISQLRKTSPRFIIGVITDTPWVWGIDITREFPDVSKFLDNCYSVAKVAGGYLIYERKNDAPEWHQERYGEEISN